MIGQIIPLILICSFAIVGCDMQKMTAKPTLKIGHISITDHLTLGVSKFKDTKQYQNFELKTVGFKGWPQLEKTLLKGDLDGAFILAPLGMQVESKMQDQGESTKVVLLGHRDGSALMIKAGSEIKTAADFKGKTIAIPDIYSIHNILLHKVITEAGLDYNTDIKTKVMTPSHIALVPILRPNSF